MNEVKLTLRDGSPVRSLLLQLGFESDCKCLSEVWRLCRKNTCPASSDPPVEPKATQRCDAPVEPQATQRSSIASSVQLSTSLCEAVDRMPSCSMWQGSEPLCSGRIPTLTVEQIRPLLEVRENGVLQDFLRDAGGAENISGTPWAKARGSAGSLIRRVSFRAPVPQDIPQTFVKMLGLPKAFDITLVARLTCTPDQITLIMHSCSLGAPFGDHFRVQDVIVFSPHAQGGAAISKWTQVVWVKPFPWHLKAAKIFMEKRIQEEGMDKFQPMVKIFTEYPSKG